jgi:hypothetical protein
MVITATTTLVAMAFAARMAGAVVAGFLVHARHGRHRLLQVVPRLARGVGVRRRPGTGIVVLILSQYHHAPQ